MRYIRTSNSIVEFIETNSEDNIISSKAFNLGELYFKIENKKVTFYLNDQENPWRNDVWTINIPFVMDNETYSTEDEASAALSKLMVLDDISQLREDLDNEILRSTNEDTKHDDLISGLTDDIADLNDEIEGLKLADSGLSEALTNEIIRSTNKDQEHDGLISGLTDDILVLDEEKQDKLVAGKYITINGNNISADSNHVYRLTQQAYDLLPEIDVEGLYIITDAPSVDLDYYAPLSALTAEIERSTEKDNEHDAAISGLTNMVDVLSADTSQVQQNLEAEIARAIAREDDIAEDLDDEFHRAQSAEHLLEDKITTERERALDAEAELAEQISGITAATSAVTNVDITNENEEIKINVAKVGGNTSERILKAGYGIKIDENGVISLDMTVVGNTLHFG